MTDLQFLVAALVSVALAIALHSFSRAAEDIADALREIAEALKLQVVNEEADQ